MPSVKIRHDRLIFIRDAFKGRIQAVCTAGVCKWSVEFQTRALTHCSALKSILRGARGREIRNSEIDTPLRGSPSPDDNVMRFWNAHPMNETTIELETLRLAQGSHKTREAGMCAMEAVAWLAGEPHSDAPKCACRVLTQYVIRLNDWWDDKERQLLKPYLPRIIGTRHGKSLERARILTHRAGTVFAPIAAEIAGRKDLADEMRAVAFGDWTAQNAACTKAWIELRSATAAADAAAADAAAAAAYAAAANAAAANAAAAGACAHAAAAATYAAGAGAARRSDIIRESLAALEAALAVGNGAKA